MGLYKLISPQRRIGRARQAALDARRKLASYDGEFSGLGSLAADSLSSSLRHVGLVTLPAIVASLPVLCMLAWLSNAYSYELPRAGQNYALNFTLATGATADDPDDPGEIGGWGHSHGIWPRPDQPWEIKDEAGRTILVLPLQIAVPTIHKRTWWNFFFGNPLGYIPDDSELHEFTVELPSRTVIDLGPGWLSGWEATFLTVLLLASVAIKFAFRIH